jgi:hypothetical protein
MVSRSLPPQGTDHQSKQIAELETPAELANCRPELERCSCLILFAFRDEACDGLRVLHAVRWRKDWSHDEDLALRPRAQSTRLGLIGSTSSLERERDSRRNGSPSRCPPCGCGSQRAPPSRETVAGRPPATRGEPDAGVFRARRSPRRECGHAQRCGCSGSESGHAPSKSRDGGADRSGTH